MPSGGITIVPGFQFAPGEKVNNAKLNQLGQPVGRVDEGSISIRELDQDTNDALNSLNGISGRNLFCNSQFTIYDFPLEPLSGIFAAGTHNHDYGSANRWVTPNDANRIAQRVIMPPGQTAVPGWPAYQFRWTQTAALSINPGYFGQRVEDVRRFSEAKITFSVYIQSDTTITVTPQIRQWFGKNVGDSPEIVIDGDPTTLVAGANFIRLTMTETLPTVMGKTISILQDSFTEFRILMPQDSTFVTNFAGPQLEVGDTATPFEHKAPWDDRSYALRYYEVIGMVLSDNISIHGKPFVNIAMRKRHDPGINVFPQSGTGATIALDQTLNMPGLITQTANHSAIVNATIIINAEIYDD